MLHIKDTIWKLIDFSFTFTFGGFIEFFVKPANNVNVFPDKYLEVFASQNFTVEGLETPASQIHPEIRTNSLQEAFPQLMLCFPYPCYEN